MRVLGNHETHWMTQLTRSIIRCATQDKNDYVGRWVPGQAVKHGDSACQEPRQWARHMVHCPSCVAVLGTHLGAMASRVAFFLCRCGFKIFLEFSILL
jgi:hypothetical protein